MRVSKVADFEKRKEAVVGLITNTVYVETQNFAPLHSSLH